MTIAKNSDPNGPEFLVTYTPERAEVYGEIHHVMKNYDGYRMVWSPDFGFGIFYSNSNPRNGSRPEQMQVDAFKKDLRGEAAGQPELNDFLRQHPGFQTDNRMVSPHEMGGDTNEREDRVCAGNTLPLPLMFRQPSDAKPAGSGPRKRTVH